MVLVLVLVEMVGMLGVESWWGGIGGRCEVVIYVLI